MAYQSSYAGAIAAQNKKKKPPNQGANTPPNMPPPQTYAQPGAGVPANQDPLVAAIQGGAAEGGFGANNQNNDRAVGTGRPTGSDVFQQNINPEANKPANMGPPLPPPPPPPIASPYASGTSTPGAPVTPATSVNPTSDPSNFAQNEPVRTETNPLSNVSTVQTMTEERSAEPVKTETNPLSNTEFVQDLTTKATEPVITETNPLSNTEFVKKLTADATEPVTPDTNPLSNPEYVQDLTAKATEPVRTETNPLSNPDFVQDLAEERSNQPLTENPLSDADFVKKLTADATEPSPYNPDAGADMAAMQNVVEPEAAPMADTLEDALRQQYMNRVGGTDDPIMASQLADQQFRQNEARKALVEQLGRYGVLRGGGDTAAALARMGEGDERNRLALEAQAAQRRQQDLRDAQGFDLGQRGMGLQETRSQQDTLTQALNRDIARAGQTGIFERDATMAAKRQRAELDALSRGQERADATLTGEFGEDGQQTLQAQRQQAELFGELDGQRTLAGQQLESQLYGEIDGRQTLTGETTQSGLDTQDIQRRIAEAGQTGLFDQEIEGVDPVETQQAKALGSELDTAALSRAATRAGATGQFIEEDAADGVLPVDTLENRLRTAAMTGFMGQDQYDEEGNLLSEAPRTLAGRQEEMDRVGAMLAAADAGVIGEGTAQQAVIEALNLTKQDDVTKLTDEQNLQAKYTDLDGEEANTVRLLIEQGKSEDEALAIVRGLENRED